ncbi:hypothetical protein CDL12_21946 [Handroanthus impetiginosus]|uniref:C3H1-type domain-containing protein n=1 Tax=Handroanthus impetiginosus TaxID=429701 RepID=A0A2G9GJN5_9LAMI|nr:hypothetical protein CDL12_21946 [Handroanthus impetiginosus]
MSFPSQTPPPHSYISQPSAGGISAGFWPPYLNGNEQNQQTPPSNFTSQQFDDPPPPFKRPKTSENSQNFTSFPPPNTRFNPANVQGTKGTSHIFYKTRICAKFMEGTCRNGEHCTFAHGQEDLREPPRNWQELIREKDRGSGSGSWGDDQRMIHRMKICKKYYNGEECPYGDKCNFLHERPLGLPPMKKFKVDMPEQRDSSAIIIGDGRGSNSDFDQVAFWKTKLCSKWEMGQCPYGERCHFAHGQSELRLSGTLNEPEPVTTTGSISRKPVSVSVTTAPATVVVGAPLNRDEEQKEALKWKLTKKINRIYGDWLDDLDSPDYEEM